MVCRFSWGDTGARLTVPTEIGHWVSFWVSWVHNDQGLLLERPSFSSSWIEIDGFLLFYLAMPPICFANNMRHPCHIQPFVRGLSDPQNVKRTPQIGLVLLWIMGPTIAILGF